MTQAESVWGWSGCGEYVIIRWLKMQTIHGGQIRLGQPLALDLREGTALPSHSQSWFEQHRFHYCLLSKISSETNVMVGVPCAHGEKTSMPSPAPLDLACNFEAASIPCSLVVESGGKKGRDVCPQLPQFWGLLAQHLWATLRGAAEVCFPFNHWQSWGGVTHALAWN